MEIVILAGVLLWVLSQSSAVSQASSSISPASSSSAGTNSITSPVTGSGGMVNPDASSFTGSVDEAFPLAAADCGAGATVLRALAMHETGDFTSALWRRANNPGGLKYQTAPAYGMAWGYVLADDDAPGERFGSFPTPGEGIRALGRFLATTRYAGLRATRDPYQQIQAIAAAGYATDPTWASKVYAKYKSLVGGSTAAPVASTSAAPSTAVISGSFSLLSSAVSAWSSSRQGDSNSDTTPDTTPDADPEFNLDDPDYDLSDWSA